MNRNEKERLNELFWRYGDYNKRRLFKFTFESAAMEFKEQSKIKIWDEVVSKANLSEEQLGILANIFQSN